MKARLWRILTDTEMLNRAVVGGYGREGLKDKTQR